MFCSSEKLTFHAVKMLVEEHLSLPLVQEWVDEISNHKLWEKAWGQDQPETFAECVITLALWKNLSSLGYQKLLKLMNSGFLINPKSLEHNMRIV